MIQRLSICTGNNIRRGDPRSTWNGLPSVLFTCLSHKDAAETPLCVLGTSLDQWSSNFFTTVSRVWRKGRFPKENPATAQLALDGARIKERFDSIPKTHYDFIRLDDFNQLNDAMFTQPRYPAPLPQQFGFLCSNEVGRSFAGHPLRGNRSRVDREMYQEMCRCWKCRYMHHYNVNHESEPGGLIEPESPVQTSVHCNIEGSCAEDLVQSQCAGLRSHEGRPMILEQPEPIISIATR